LDSKTIIEEPHVIDAQEKVHTAHAKLNQLVLRISMKVIIQQLQFGMQKTAAYG
jgi:hypothetical protein